MAHGLRVAFVGLGRMGLPMALRVSQKFPVAGWNRSPKAVPEGLQLLPNLEVHCKRVFCLLTALPLLLLLSLLLLPRSHACFQAVSKYNVIITCVSNSAVVRELLEKMWTHVRQGTVVVDCTSGDPDASKKLAEKLLAIGVEFIDAPVSGGITGAEQGTLTTMVGGSILTLETVRPVLETFSTNIVHVGEQAGCGHALKGVNNLMNVAHLMIAGEALIALARRGVRPDVALAAINGSSGRSLATMQRFPEHVLTRKFAHGFSVSLMDKDAGIGAAVVRSSFPSASILPQAARAFHDAGKAVGGKADYTEVIKYLEEMGDVELRAGPLPADD
jgi:3-hydroxyisobutyrate dehydrogenase